MFASLDSTTAKVFYMASLSIKEININESEYLLQRVLRDWLPAEKRIEFKDSSFNLQSHLRHGPSLDYLKAVYPWVIWLCAYVR